MAAGRYADANRQKNWTPSIGNVFALGLAAQLPYDRSARLAPAFDLVANLIDGISACELHPTQAGPRDGSGLLEAFAAKHALILIADAHPKGVSLFSTHSLEELREAVTTIPIRSSGATASLAYTLRKRFRARHDQTVMTQREDILALSVSAFPERFISELESVDGVPVAVIAMDTRGGPGDNLFSAACFARSFPETALQQMRAHGSA